MSVRTVPIVVEERNRRYDEEAVRELKKLSPEDLLTNWWNTWDPSRSLMERDSIVEAMKQKEIYPSDWMHTRESTLGLYPDTLDPKFAAHLFEKKEFSDLQSVRKETDTCGSANFDITAVQRLIARFMNPDTPYTSTLLFHGVGVGKTCTAITVAEAFLRKHPTKKVFILVPPSIQDTFTNTIFNVNLLVEIPAGRRSLYGRRWNSSQCTGLTYLELTDMLNEPSLEKIKSAVAYMIKQRYLIVGYGAFANYVEKNIYGLIPKYSNISKEERIKLENLELYKHFSDHLLIIDEAHNLRNIGGKRGGGGAEVDVKQAGDSAEGKKVRQTLDRLLPVADGLRLLLMTATPMFNISIEIIGLLNLLILNDTKTASYLLDIDDFFKKGDYHLKAGADAKLRMIAQRYVSYMRGEDPISFPLRLNPPSSLGNKIITEYPTISISKKEVTIALPDHLESIMKSLPLVATEYSSSTYAGRILQKALEKRYTVPVVETLEVKDEDEDEEEEEEEEEEGEEGNDLTEEEIDIDIKMLDPIIMLSNIVYPPNIEHESLDKADTGIEGWKRYFHSESFGYEPRLLRYYWNFKEPTVDSIFSPTNLPQYAPKMATIINSLQNATGIGFVYSRFVIPGIIPFAIALERAGWTRILANGKESPLLIEAPKLTHGRQCALCPHHEIGHDTTNHAFTAANYIILTGDTEITPKVSDAVQYATTFPKEDPYAPYGSRVKAILGSSIASEVLDLKCIREIHLLDPWYHLNRVEQVIGRGVRYCSHMLLKPEERNTLIYCHVAKMKRIETVEYETADLYAYRLAGRKSIPIGIIQRALKVAAFDCNIHRNVLFSDNKHSRYIIDAQGVQNKYYNLGDKPYSSFCDFISECSYDCKSKIPDEKVGSDGSTYKFEDIMRRIDIQFDKLRSNFQKFSIVYMGLYQVKTTFFPDIPWEYVALGFRRKLNNPYYLIEQKDGTRGVFRVMNGYLVVHPLSVTEEEIPTKLRYGTSYGRLPIKMRSPLVSLFKQKIISSEVSLETTAIANFVKWDAELDELLLEENAYDKERPTPDGIKQDIYRNIQWMHYRFRDFINIKPILLQFYIDKIWTFEERSAVLHGLIQRRNTDAENSTDTILYPMFHNPEVFETTYNKNEIIGYLSVSKKGVISQHYKIGDGPIQELSTGEIVDHVNHDVLEKPLNGLDRCAPLYGFHAFTKDTIIFKTLNKLSLDPKSKKFKGFNCDGASNLKPLYNIINILYAYQKEHAITDLEPMKLIIEKVKEKKICYLDKDAGLILKGPSICLYIEILLRAFQSIETTDLQWVLSMVDSVRAEEVISQKGKTDTFKKLFKTSFTWVS